MCLYSLLGPSLYTLLWQISNDRLRYAELFITSIEHQYIYVFLVVQNKRLRSCLPAGRNSTIEFIIQQPIHSQAYLLHLLRFALYRCCSTAASIAAQNLMCYPHCLGRIVLSRRQPQKQCILQRDKRICHS